jgi:hypothetical protein
MKIVKPPPSDDSRQRTITPVIVKNRSTLHHQQEENMGLLSFLSSSFGKSRPIAERTAAADSDFVAKLVSGANAKGVSIAIVRRDGITIDKPPLRARGHIIFIDDTGPSTGPAPFTFDAISSIRFVDSLSVSSSASELPDYWLDCGLDDAQIRAIIRADDAHVDAWWDLAMMFRRGKHASVWTCLHNGALTRQARRRAAKMAKRDIQAEADRRDRYAAARRNLSRLSPA